MAQAQARPSQSIAACRRADRLEAHVATEQNSLLEHAAALQGRTVTDFVLTSVQGAAQRAIEDHEVICLSVQDTQAFVDVILNARLMRASQVNACVRGWRGTCQRF